MPREEKDAQLVFRAEQALKTELEAVAKTLDRSSAKILRDILADGLPKWRKKADEEIARRDALPHGVTDDEVEKALATLLRQWAQGVTLTLEVGDALTARSKALWILLGFIWGDGETGTAAAERLAAVVAKFDFKPEGKKPR